MTLQNKVALLGRFSMGHVTTAVLTAALTACGGGEGGVVEYKASNTATTVTFADTVEDDSSSAAVSGAKVVLATSTAAGESTTGSDGKYSIVVKRAALPATYSSTTIYLTITGGSEYQPLTVSYNPANIVAGGIYTLADGTSAGSLRLHKLAQTEFAPSGADANLTRLGDGVASGEANVGFQVTAGPFSRSATIKLGDLSKLAIPAGSTVQSRYPTMNLSIDFRGLQASICTDKVTLYQSNSPSGNTQDGFVQTFSSSSTPPLSDTGVGSLSTWTTGSTIATAGLTPNAAHAALWVKIDSGACTLGGALTGFDDFEFANIRAAFYSPS
ncbi:MAG TPA: hypothetical protein PKE61_03885 [Burkholderiaceae bacterium]|nr:hypothetical protein [Burkholderiaceae bacterium]HNB44133.1 hypothetical protein [Burkholderiaceae bacterium]